MVVRLGSNWQGGRNVTLRAYTFKYKHEVARAPGEVGRFLIS